MAEDEPRTGDLTTANYGWTKPAVGGDLEVWGGYLNADLDGIDSTVKSVSNVANAAYPASNPSGYQTAAQVAAVVIGDTRIINGNFAFNQRVYVSGTALPATPVTAAYGHDRWKAGAGGCTYTFTAAIPDTTVTITVGTLTQIIEAGVIEGGVYTLSWTGTAQARVYQGTPTGSYAASPLTTTSLPAGTNTIVEFNTGTLTRVKLEIGTVATPFNRQSMAKSIAECQRYYATGQIISGGTMTTGQAIYGPYSLPVTMRASPTLVIATNGSTNVSSPAISALNARDLYAQGTATATGAANINFSITASAEL
jgi:hypothetical protein